MGLWQSGNDQKVVNELEDNIGMTQSEECRVKILGKRESISLGKNECPWERKRKGLEEWEQEGDLFLIA